MKRSPFTSTASKAERLGNLAATGPLRAVDIPLVRPTITVHDEEYLNCAIRRGALTGDDEVTRFEGRIAAYLGVEQAVAVSSGTAALHLALAALGVSRGDEVILPSYTCIALLHTVRLLGARPVLVDHGCDVAGADFTPTVRQYVASLGPKTRAVLFPQMFGKCVAVEERIHGVPVIEDFTLSFGAIVDGRLAGTLGFAGVASLHESKMLSAGCGGVVVSNDKAFIHEIRRLAHYDQPMTEWRTMDTRTLKRRYTIAYSYGLSGLQAALGNSQLDQLPAFISRRMEIARRYSHAFRDAEVSCPEVSGDGGNVFYRYMVRCGSLVPQVIGRLRDEGIELGRGVFPPLHTLLNLSDSRYPTTANSCASLLSIPIYPSLDEDTVEKIIGQVLLAVQSR